MFDYSVVVTYFLAFPDDSCDWVDTLLEVVNFYSLLKRSAVFLIHGVENTSISELGLPLTSSSHRQS